MKRVVFFLAGMILLLYTPLKAQDNKANFITKHIEQITGTFVAAEALGNMNNRNAMIFPPGSAAIDRKAIVGFWQRVRDIGINHITLESIEIYNYGDKVIEVGKYSIRGRKGKFRVVWKQENGRWVLHSETWNKNGLLNRASKDRK